MDPQTHEARRNAMAVLAQASSDAIANALIQAKRDIPLDDIPIKDVRPAETGLVMLRGRIGGNGAPFNVGEATVTRAAVRLSTGETGFSYVLGRDGRKARLAALCDALWQHQQYRMTVEQHVIVPLRAFQQQQRAYQQMQTAATRVDFFTLVRGEDDTCPLSSTIPLMRARRFSAR